ncbi:MAG: Peptide deformylase [Parcubacteria group bacterium GW2011_GWC1_34_10]|nr:MAG: Peptide deformylase [Parcubacteria group bacterium GW2011_GWC1_34_10]
MGSVIVQKEDKILRKTSKEVAISDIKKPKIKEILKKMKEALNAEEDGVAIAAPQIGENLRIFVISKKIFEIMDEEKIQNKTPKIENENILKDKKGKNIYKDMVFINPKILKTSKKQMLAEEGCLSVRWLYGKVKRAEKTLIKAYDENGKFFTFGGSGLLSQAFQHETDHLDGILFTDKAINLKEIIPERTSIARSSDNK